MQVSMASFVGLILASGGFCTALVVVGVYIGSLNGKFVSQINFNKHEQLMLKELKGINKNITDLRVEFTKIETKEKIRKETGES